MSPARAALEAVRNGGKPKPAMAASVTPVPVKAETASVPPWDEEPPPAPEWGPYDAAVAEAQKKTESIIAAAAQVTQKQVTHHDTAVIEEAAPPAETQPVAKTKPLAPTPIPSLNWDGDWPALAAGLPLRGVVQQLAQQSELLQCEDSGDGVQVHLRIPVDTLRTAGAVDKLATALGGHFGKTVRVTTEIGAVAQTANAAAIAEREARQREAEENMQRDPFVQAMIREFNAIIVPGSIKPV